MEALQRLHNRGSISTGYDIDNSVKFETGNNEWLYRASPTAGNRRTFTFSFWIKRTGLGTVNASGVQYVVGQGQHGRMYFTSDYFGFRFDDGHDTRDITTKHRDPAAWLHVVVAVDTNQSSSSNRVKIYFNGVQTTTIDFDGGSYPDLQDQASGWFTTNYLTIGTAPFGGSYNNGDGDYDMSGYLAEFCAVDGQQLAPTDFGEFDSDSGIWKPIDVSGINFGSEGYYLNFADAADLGDDESGNGNDFTENNIAAADQATDTPTNNFATLNVLNRNSASSGVTNNSVFTEGNTKITGNLNGYWQSGVSTIGITSGKWYFEAKPYDSNTKICTIGYGDEADIENWGKNNDFPGAASSKSYGYAGGTASGYGQIIPSTNKPSPAVTYNQTNIIGVAIDADNGYVYWSKDGTYVNSGNPASGASGTGGIAIPTGTGTNGTLLPAVGFYYDSTVPIMLVNFGGYTNFTISSAASDANGYGTFEYAPPTGYYALCTKNLEEYG